MNLNVGSAPNPTSSQIRSPVIVEERATVAPAAIEAVASPPPEPPFEAPLVVAEAPPPPPAIREFIVFFDFDKSNLTPEAMQVVGAAVTTAKESGMARILVTGHTDTVGSQRYNQALSERRAATVKAEMVRLGMLDTGIRVAGKSFSEPLVPTGPGVREPQNRRAVIDLGYDFVARLDGAEQPQ
jgi:outer membrane protein OmpA-like peptidoglycan-associated protein